MDEMKQKQTQLAPKRDFFFKSKKENKEEEN